MGYDSKARILNTYCLCPIPEKDDYSNAKVVILVREINEYWEKDYAYVFSGPFGENYTKESVLAGDAKTCYEYSDESESSERIKQSAKGLVVNDECKYEWQEMD